MERALADRGYEVINLAYWGDTIREISERLEFVEALKNTKAKILLLGGGGNDLLQYGRLQQFLKIFDEHRPVKDYLKPEFTIELARVMSSYEICLSALKANKLSKVMVVVHGYDYAQPMSLGWLGEPLETMGIDDAGLQKSIIKHMMDLFNNALKAMARNHANVVYVNLRNTVKNRWHDELHPSKEAFADIAKKIEQTITEIPVG